MARSLEFELEGSHRSSRRKRRWTSSYHSDRAVGGRALNERAASEGGRLRIMVIVLSRAACRTNAKRTKEDVLLFVLVVFFLPSALEETAEEAALLLSLFVGFTGFAAHVGFIEVDKLNDREGALSPLRS